MERSSSPISLQETNGEVNHTDNDVTSSPDEATEEQSKGKWCVGSKGVIRLNKIKQV